MSLRDHRNTELSTSNRTLVTGYEQAVELLAGYYLDPLAAIDGTLAEDPDFVSGHVFRGALGLLAFERAGQPLVEAAVEQGARLAARGSRERSRAAPPRWLARLA